jgi:hypothetical protein
MTNGMVELIIGAVVIGGVTIGLAVGFIRYALRDRRCNCETCRTVWR